MEEFSYNFKNTGEKANNDVVYEERTFKLDEKGFIFRISPNQQKYKELIA